MRFDIASTALVGHVMVLAVLLTTLLQVMVVQRWWLIGGATATVFALHLFGASWFGPDLTFDFHTNAILAAGAIGLGNSMVGSIARAAGAEGDPRRSTLH